MIKAGIITGYGINADIELGDAFRGAGADPEFFHITSLLEDPGLLERVQILAFPGGFSFGDHLGSGLVFAQLVKKTLKPALRAFIDKGRLVIGICNGFQVLVKMGLLPNLDGEWTPSTSLITNAGGTFIDRWVSVRYNTLNASPWIRGLSEGDLPIRHGEGRFVTLDAAILKNLEEKNLIALRYLDNPNGSTADIAGITDPTGRILGLMPHPEAFTVRFQHPHWRRKEIIEPLGLKVFQNGVDYMRSLGRI